MTFVAALSGRICAGRERERERAYVYVYVYADATKRCEIEDQ